MELKPELRLLPLIVSKVYLGKGPKEEELLFPTNHESVGKQTSPMTAAGFTSLLRFCHGFSYSPPGQGYTKSMQGSHQGMKPVQIHYTLEGIHDSQASPGDESADMLCLPFFLFINTCSHLEASSPGQYAQLKIRKSL